MKLGIVGTWILKFWRRFLEDGTVVFPFGEDASGLLIYTEDGNMAVQMLTEGRSPLNTEDPVGGDGEECAAAYSSCLAYFGTYEVEDQTVIHKVEGALFPNWSDTLQRRPFVLDGNELSLQVVDDDGRLTNEMVWMRKGSDYDRLEEFLKLSVCFTGFGRFQLLSTNMAEAYLSELDAILRPELLEELLDVFRGLPAGEGLDSAISKQILDNSRLGPVARNILLMWYCGTWKALPQEWRASYGASALDTDHVVSARAYLSGLQWTVVGAHPPGGLPQGFAAWSAPAKGYER